MVCLGRECLALTEAHPLGCVRLTLTSVAAGALSLGNWLARAAARCCGLSAMALLVAERRASCSLRFALACGYWPVS